MNVNAAGLDLIKAHEGLRLTAYLCPAGKWTIGYGHSSAAGDPMVSKGMKISRDEAEAILRRDVDSFAKGVAALVTVPLNDNQFSALVSFAFNVGLANFRDSSVRTAVNAHRFDGVSGRLALWNKARVKGKLVPLDGLTKRRAEEGMLFMAVAASKVGPVVTPPPPDIAAPEPPQARQPDDPGTHPAGPIPSYEQPAPISDRVATGIIAAIVAAAAALAAWLGFN